jgi:hypothetical protein
MDVGVRTLMRLDMRLSVRHDRRHVAQQEGAPDRVVVEAAHAPAQEVKIEQSLRLTALLQKVGDLRGNRALPRAVDPVIKTPSSLRNPLKKHTDPATPSHKARAQRRRGWATPHAFAEGAEFPHKRITVQPWRSRRRRADQHGRQPDNTRSAATLACKTRSKCPALSLASEDAPQASVSVSQCPSPLVSVVGVTWPSPLTSRSLWQGR